MIPTALQRRIFVAAGLLALFVSAPATQTNDTPVRYTAMAVNMGAPVRWTTLTVEMVVKRWSTDAETNLAPVNILVMGSDTREGIGNSKYGSNNTEYGVAGAA